MAPSYLRFIATKVYVVGEEELGIELGRGNCTHRAHRTDLSKTLTELSSSPFCSSSHVPMEYIEDKKFAYYTITLSRQATAQSSDGDFRLDFPITLSSTLL